MTDPAPSPTPPVPPKGRRPPPSVETWAEARSRYLQGYTARQVCKTLNICLSSFRHRAARDGWRRFDQPSPAWPENWTVDDEEDLPEDAFDLRAHAWRHAARAVVRGDRLSARTWLKLSQDLLAITQQQLANRDALVADFEDDNEALAAELSALGVDPDTIQPAYPDDGRFEYENPLPLDDAISRGIALKDALVAARSAAADGEAVIIHHQDTKAAKTAELTGEASAPPNQREPSISDADEQTPRSWRPSCPGGEIPSPTDEASKLEGSDSSDSSDPVSPESDPPESPEPVPHPWALELSAQGRRMAEAQRLSEARWKARVEAARRPGGAPPPSDAASVSS